MCTLHTCKWVILRHTVTPFLRSRLAGATAQRPPLLIRVRVMIASPDKFGGDWPKEKKRKEKQKERAWIAAFKNKQGCTVTGFQANFPNPR